MANHFGSSTLKPITAFPAITGWDSVSSFYGVKNKTALTTLWSNFDDFIKILQFGESLNLDLQEACVEAVIKFVCLLYDNKSKDADINGTDALFQENLISWKLPPSIDVLTLHLRRAAFSQNFGSFISCQKLLGYYWGVSNDILEQLSCWCQKGCKTMFMLVARLILYVQMHVCVTKEKIEKHSWF